jgi:undecaprenyl diphosphate synthase
MDGNRRWATQQGFATLFGHKQGMATINKVADFCLAKSIPYLSLYTFSIENLKKRSEQEQQYLFEILAREAEQELSTFQEKSIKIRFVGDRTLFPQSVQSICERLEAGTKEGTALTINLLLCYGGQQEIVDTTKRLAAKVASGELKESDITSEVFENHLWTAGIPHPNLIIRTGDQQRLSNFLLYQSAYAELYFLKCMWPDISEQELESALTYYHECRKMFGK